MTEPVNVTSPYLPPLEEVLPYLEEIWDRYDRILVKYHVRPKGALAPDTERVLVAARNRDELCATDHLYRTF